MSKVEQPGLVTVFDYDTLDAEQKILIQQRTGEIKERLRRSAQDIWEIGQKLADVRSRLKHGQFDTWLKAEFDWSRRTAYNFISVYEAFDERANLAQVDIGTTALYTLAAPSTPQKVRQQVLQEAKEGKPIGRKELRQLIETEKSELSVESKILRRETTEPASTSSERSRPSGSAVARGGDPKTAPHFPAVRGRETAGAALLHLETTGLPLTSSNPAPEIVAIIPKATLKSDNLAETVATALKTVSYPVDTYINPQYSWYRLEKQHWLFCGDTASPEFAERISEAALAIAITSNDWDHDWLVDRAKSVLIFPESDLKEGTIEQLIEMFSQPGETVVFPWLPDAKMIAIAHQLGRKVLAGDVNLQRCQQAAIASGLRIEPIDLQAIFPEE